MNVRDYGQDDGFRKVAPFPKNALNRVEEKIVPKNKIRPLYSPDENERVFVKSNTKPFKDGGDVVVFNETHPLHPNGECLIAGSEPVLVALTPKVSDALNSGVLLEATDNEVRTFRAQKLENTRKAIEKKREVFRRKYIALVGSESGFSDAWESYKAKEVIEQIAAELGESLPVIS